MAGSFQNEIPPARINLKLDGKRRYQEKVELPFKIAVSGFFKRRNLREFLIWKKLTSTKIIWTGYGGDGSVAGLCSR